MRCLSTLGKSHNKNYMTYRSIRTIDKSSQSKLNHTLLDVVKVTIETATTSSNQNPNIEHASSMIFQLTHTWDSLHARLNSHCKAWSYKKKKHKKIKAYRKSLQKEPTVNRCLLILDLKPFRSYVKGKQSVGREFQGLAVLGEKLLTQSSL